jgi:hypothetical protein
MPYAFTVYANADACQPGLNDNWFGIAEREVSIREHTVLYDRLWAAQMDEWC